MRLEMIRPSRPRSSRKCNGRQKSDVRVTNWLDSSVRPSAGIKRPAGPPRAGRMIGQRPSTRMLFTLSEAAEALRSSVALFEGLLRTAKSALLRWKEKSAFRSRSLTAGGGQGCNTSAANQKCSRGCSSYTKKACSAPALDDRELGRAAAHVDVKERCRFHRSSVPRLSRRLRAWPASGGRQWRTRTRRPARPEIPPGNAFGIVAAQRLAREDHHAGVDVVGLEARRPVGVVDELAERAVSIRCSSE